MPLDSIRSRATIPGVSELEAFRTSLAMSRQAGMSFSDAWKAARRLVRGRDWPVVLEETRDAWRAAYLGEPAPRRLRALHAVAHDEDRETVRTRGASASTCGGLIPATRQRNAIYCGAECQRAAHGRRVAA